MKTILKLAFLLVLLIIAQSNSQTWKELMDSVNFYREKQEFETALKWAKLALSGVEKEFGRNDTNYVAALGTVASLFYYTGQLDSAIQYQEENLKVTRIMFKNDHLELANSISNMAVFYNSQGKFAEAEPLYKEALEMRRRLYKGDHPDLAMSINNMASFYEGRGNYNDAEPLFKEALDMYRRVYKGDHPDLANSINSMASFYAFRRGRYTEAETLYKEALDMYRRVYKGDHPDLASCINNVAFFYDMIGRYAEAELLYKEALEITKRVFKGDHPDLVNSIQNMGVFYHVQGRFAEAEPLLSEALAMSRRIFKGDHPELSKNLCNLATFYVHLGNYPMAEILYKEALEMIKRIYKGDHLDVALTLNSIASFYQITGKFSEAEQLYKESLEMNRRIFSGDHPVIVESINNIACYYDAIGRFAEAEALFLEALDMNRRLIKGDRISLAFSIQNMASFCNKQGKFQEAGALFQEALEIRRRLFKDDHPDLASGLIAMAVYYQNIGNYVEAESLFKEGSEMLRRIFKGDHPEVAASINYLGVCYLECGRYEEAEALLIEAQEMRRRIFKGDHPDLANSINCVALTLFKRGKYSDSEPLFKEALEMRRRISKNDNPNLAITLNNVADLYANLGKYSEAEPLYKESIQMFRQVFEGDHPILASVINNLANLFEIIGRYDEAESLYKEALLMFRRILDVDHPDLAGSMNSLAKFYVGRGKIDEAEPLFLESYNSMMKHIQTQFPYMNENQKIQFWSTKSGIINSFYRFASIYNKQKPEISQQMADITLATKGIVHNSTKKAFESIRESKRLFEDWQNTRQFWLHLVQNPQKAKKMGVNVDSVEKEASRLETEISKQSSQFKKTFDTSRVRWQDVQKSLRNGEAAIEIVRFTDWKERGDSVSVQYSFIVIKPDSKYPELVVLENGNELEGRYIKKYRDILETEKKKTGRKSLLKIEGYPQEEYELYNAFWQKAQEKLGGIERVYVSLDGVYNQFNLNTLRNPATNKYLLEELDIRILTSTRDLAGRNPLSPPLKMVDMSAALFANPKFNLRQEVKSKTAQLQLPREIMPEGLLSGALAKMAVKGIEPLPGTKIEVETVSSDFEKNGLKADKYLEATAMKSKLMTIKDPKILHIATHGLFLKDIEYLKEDPGLEERRYYENPLLKSMLLLSGAENTLRGDPVSEDDDGILTAYEVMNMDLDHTELVVLSACETGLGEIKNGEGVYGLQRAFQTAGAKSIIMSLWKVSDEATQELMTSFYSKWLGGKSKREAFREAQIELKQKYPGFYYWGAFVMVGE